MTSQSIFKRYWSSTAILAFKGRISRGAFFCSVIPLALLGLLPAVVTDCDYMIMPGYIAVAFPILALNVRRCHDRDKSGWYILIQLLPVIGPLFFFIYILLRKGTEGPNSFGPVPNLDQPQTDLIIRKQESTHIRKILFKIALTAALLLVLFLVVTLYEIFFLKELELPLSELLSWIFDPDQEIGIGIYTFLSAILSSLLYRGMLMREMITSGR